MIYIYKTNRIYMICEDSHMTHGLISDMQSQIILFLNIYVVLIVYVRYNDCCVHCKIIFAYFICGLLIYKYCLGEKKREKQ